MEKKNKGLRINGSILVLMCALVLVVVVFTSLNKNFLSYTNMINILVAASLVGLVAIGETYLIIAGLNDLSPGSVAAFSGVLAALLVSKMAMPFPVAVVITLVVAMAAGLFNAWMVSFIKLEPFILSLIHISEPTRP